MPDQARAGPETGGQGYHAPNASAPCDEDAESGPGLAHAIGLMTLGAMCASVWWAIVLVAVLLLRD